jgi:hypothetical protein
MRHVLVLVGLAALTFGQTFEVRDRNGIPMVAISDVKMTRYSGITEFQGIVKNISGQDLKFVSLQVIAHKKDGSELRFEVNVCDASRWATAASTGSTGGCDYEHSLFHKDSTQAARNPFLESDDFASEIGFSFPASWQSPEDERLAAEAQAKKEAADAARRKRVEAEQKRRDAERNARLATYRAEEEAKAAERQRKIRGACALIYQNTADKKLKDLTVKEEQQVRSCQALGLYQPQ